MKRKVQAQRKFAQGAFVPPSAVSNLPPERRVAASIVNDPPPPENTVYNSKMSADMLLDVISFQNLHKQRVPVVLLRRLGKIQNPGPAAVVEPNNHEPVRQRVAQTTATKSENKMMLRSRPSFKTQIIKKPFLRKRNIPRQISIPDNSDLEDDRPLKYFARTEVAPRRQLRINAQAKKIKITRNRNRPKDIAALKKSMIIVQDKKLAVGSKRGSLKNIARTKESKIKKRRLNAVTEKHEKVASRYSSDEGPQLSYSSDELPALRYSTESESETANPSVSIGSKELTSTSKTVGKVCQKEKKTILENVLDKPNSSFKMPLRPNRRRNASLVDQGLKKEVAGVAGVVERKTRRKMTQTVVTREKKPVAAQVNGGETSKQVTNEQSAPTSEERNQQTADRLNTSQTLKETSLSNRSAPLSHFAARRHASIEGWLEDTAGNRKSLSSPLPAAVRFREKRRESVESLCPSERFKCVRDIVNAAERDLESSCKQRNCQACCRVNKLRQLKNMVQRSTVPDDVYEFNDDASVDSYCGVYTRLTQVQQETPPPPQLEADDHHVYLDILPNGSHIIQITNINKRNTMISASVIPKCKADIQNEFSLIEHENLLDQLLAKLQQTSNPEEREKVFKLSTGKQTASKTQSRGEEPNVSQKCNESPSNRSFRQNPSKKASDPSSSRQSDLNGTENSSLSRGLNNAQLLEAPVFYPSEAEFTDPIAYFEKIAPSAAKYGICKVVPPAGFHPSCSASDEIRFNVSNQYIARLYSRWGQAAQEMCAIRAYLASQSVMFARSPLYEGIEVNLPKLYHIVQHNGGLKNVIEKKRWGRVAEEMRYTRTPNAEKRLDQLYVKYLLPYDTLSTQERLDIMLAVERCWNKKNRKMLDRALNPLHRQKRLLGESESSGDEAEEEDHMAWALAEAEDCVVSGRSMTLSTFKKVASNAMETLFPSTELPTVEEVEKKYWRLVLLGTEHVCVNTASIDTGEDGHGFTKNKTDPYGKHPWNLKMLSQNSGNVLRSLGPVLGVTVPTLHLGMMLSTSCWHRDPHGLPWIEYMHSGPPSIWYGIPDEQSDNFRKAVETLCPTSCQNKSIWLPSDITMIPPELLLKHNVTLSRVVQRPAEFVIVFPKAYSCSICTGYTQSESVYFATTSWLKNVTQVFQELRDSCEPTMFSLEQLLIAVATDSRVHPRTLADVLANLSVIVRTEIDNRKALLNAGVPSTNAQQQKRVRQPKKRPAGAWNVREQDECEICRSTLYLSKVANLTGKRSSVCLQHALRLLQTGHEAREGTLVVYFSICELEDAVESAKRRLNPCSSSTPRRRVSVSAGQTED